MTCDPNDPRLTAFVLGELDPAEHTAVETMLGESADCRQTVDEIRMTVGWLTSQLHDESEAHAEPVGPKRIASAADPLQVVAGGRPRWSQETRQVLRICAASVTFVRPLRSRILTPVQSSNAWARRCRKSR